MGGEHHLDGIGNQLPGAQGIFHPLVVHGQAVAHPDGAKGKGYAPGVADPRLHRLGDGVQMGVAGYVVALRTDHGHEGRCV